MANDLVKRMVKKDGSQRISFYREEYADNPRDMLDEPMHCEDFARDSTIMLFSERNNRSESPRALMVYLLENFGDRDRIIAKLKRNATEKTHDEYDCSLQYNRSTKEWRLVSWEKPYGKSDWGWYELTSYDCKLEDLTIEDLMLDATDECLTDCINNHLSDKVKVCSYSFGYYGGVTFSEEVDMSEVGVCWIEKDEWLKWSGNTEEWWNTRSIMDIEVGVFKEIDAWSQGEVCCFEVEDAVKSKIRKTYLNVEREDEEYEATEWESSDSCGGFYGELDDIIVGMFDCAGLKIEDFEEEKEDNE